MSYPTAARPFYRPWLRPCLPLLLLFVLLGLPALCLGAEDENSTAPQAPPTWMRTGWSAFVRGGYVHQIDADTDRGGTFRVNRFFIEAGPDYSFSPGRGVSLKLDYGKDDYNFSGHTGLSGAHPWDTIHSFRVSLPIRWMMDRQLHMFLAPSFEYTGESGADFHKALTGKAMFAFAYRFGDRLTLGPGIIVAGNIEDDPYLFPILLIDWKITETLSLNTGSGSGVTRGPGLTLDWQPSQRWKFSLSGRYEELRFRLDDQGTQPDGVGEERSIPVVGAATYTLGERGTVSLIAGTKFWGNLRLEDENGDKVQSEAYDPAGIVGLLFNFRW